MIKPMNSRLTVKDLARLSRVSLRVVTEVLSGRPSGEKVRFSDETRERVMSVASKYDYRPNRAARSLQNRRHNAVAIYVGPSIYHVHDHTLNRILECCRGKGVIPVIEIFSRNRDEMPVSLREHAIDGAVVFADIPEIEQVFEQKKLPVVYVNTNRRNGENCITYDEKGGVKLAMDHFKSSGRARTGLVFSETSHYSGESRFKDMLRRLGGGFPSLELHSRLDSHDQRRSIILEIGGWLNSNPGIDSVILGADALAPLFYEAASRNGMRIPADISLMAYNDLGVSQLIQPEVTSLAVDYNKLAEISLEMLYDMIDGKKPSGPVTVPYLLARRQSA